jgi:TPR repeat protein
MMMDATAISRAALSGRDGAVSRKNGLSPRGGLKPVARRLFGLARAGALMAVLAGAVAVGTGTAHAFDEKNFEKQRSSPWAVFRFGFSAYKNGHKEQAVEAYRYAADNGQIGASWKLAHMYAEGDGVERNDYEAFKFFNQIVQEDVDPGSPDDSYISDALVALGAYYKTGIPGTPVKPNIAAAQDYYMRAAATYRNPAAQFEIGKMFLNGEGVKASVKLAGRWLQLAAEKGHAGAQALLGNLLFQSGKVVRGLAMMTAALAHAAPGDQPWIRNRQEEAFALSGESDRRTAIALADTMWNNNTTAAAEK